MSSINFGDSTFLRSTFTITWPLLNTLTFTYSKHFQIITFTHTHTSDSHCKTHTQVSLHTHWPTHTTLSTAQPQVGERKGPAHRSCSLACWALQVYTARPPLTHTSYWITQKKSHTGLHPPLITSQHTCSRDGVQCKRSQIPTIFVPCYDCICDSLDLWESLWYASCNKLACMQSYTVEYGLRNNLISNTHLRWCSPHHSRWMHALETIGML